MNTKREKAAGRRRVPKDDWLAEALDLLAESGVDSIRVDRLSRRVGVAKTSFYWHFTDRQDLLDQILNYWEHEFTQVASDNPLLASLPAVERLHALSEMICDYRLAQYDVAVAHWAKTDDGAAQARQRVIDQRAAFVRRAFRELGFRGDDLEMRVRLYACYHTFEGFMFDTRPGAKTRKLRRLRIQLLCQPLQ